jgi:hypothetical protein
VPSLLPGVQNPDPLPTENQEIEKTIVELEQQLHNDTQALIKASHEQDGHSITKLSKSLKQTRTETDTLYKELEDTSEKYEQSKLAFKEEELTYK